MNASRPAVVRRQTSDAGGGPQRNQFPEDLLTLLAPALPPGACIAALSSVAGDRGRARVGVYGASKAGLDAFFKDHVFIDMGRKRPIPHESWYQTAAYYYYYDHYYLSRLLEALPASDRKAYFEKLIATVLPHQEPDDGSWWDFAMWDFHKPYGTAFAIMTLLRCRDGV